MSAEKVDFLSELFRRGLHQILEDIILNLDLRTMLACQTVNHDWQKIVDFLLQSRNSKFLKVKEIKISQEWFKKKPMIFTVSMEKFNIDQIKCLHIIGDEHEVAVAANVNGTRKAKIILIDPKTCAIKSVLGIANSAGVELDVIEVKMSFDSNFLVAFIQKENLNEKCFYQVWNRSDNYSSKYPKTACRPEDYHKKFGLKGLHLRNIPILSNGHLCISKQGSPILLPNSYKCGLELKLDVWKISENTHETIITSFPYDIYTDHYFGQYFSHKFGLLTQDLCGDKVLKTITYNSKENFWNISVIRGFYPKAVGYSDQYIAIHWYHCAHSILKIHRVSDGTPVLNVFIEPAEAWQTDFTSLLDFNIRDPFVKDDTNQVQFSDNRIALKGSVRTGRLDPGNQNDDLTIFDLKTEQIILSCGKDLGFTSIGKFLIHKTYLCLESRGQIVLAKFWV